MNINLVTQVNSNLFIVSRGNIHVGIYFEGELVVVASSCFCNDNVYVPFNKVCSSESSARNEFNRLLGVVCSSDMNSYYWENVDTEAHLRNGNSTMVMGAKVIELSDLIHAEISRLLDV